MSQSQQATAGAGESAGKNGLGIAGFVTSLVAICTGFLLSPIALLLSAIALFKKPKGFAIAGTIIGGLGSIVLAIGAILVVSAGSTIVAMGWQGYQAWQTLQQGDGRIQQARQNEGQLPETQAGRQMVDDIQDPWGQTLRYERQGGDYRVISAGPDKQFGTGDDLRFKQGKLHMGSDSSFGQGGNQ
jgi:hypothetical protein